MDISWIENVNTIDDVTEIIDELAAHVVWMSLDEKLREVAFKALTEALEKIEKEI
jgi:hypothetical protein